jgi:hypothetical protein
MGICMSERNEVYALAFAEGIRTLGNQAATLDQLRIRSAGVLTTATIASVFLVGIATGAYPSDQDLMYWILVMLGTVLYAALLVLVVLLQLPRYRWKFDVSPRLIVEGYADARPPATIDEVHRELAFFIDGNIAHNRRNLEHMHGQMGTMLLLLVAEVAVWAMLVAKTA